MLVVASLKACNYCVLCQKYTINIVIGGFYSRKLCRCFWCGRSSKRISCFKIFLLRVSFTLGEIMICRQTFQVNFKNIKKFWNLFQNKPVFYSLTVNNKRKAINSWKFLTYKNSHMRIYIILSLFSKAPKSSLSWRNLMLVLFFFYLGQYSD